MRALRLPAVAYASLTLLGLVPAVRWLFPAICLIALVVIGELWLRALVGEVISPVARVGLGAAAGLVSLPLVAIVLHVLGVPVRTRSLSAGLAVLVTLLGAAMLLRGRRAPVPADPRLPAVGAAVAIPVALALLIAGGAVTGYRRSPHPPAPGYLSVALNGWAARVDGPVTIPPRGLNVPIRVSSAGEPAGTALLRVWVGALSPAPARPVPVAADSTGSLEVHVPMPPNGCLYRIEISLEHGMNVVPADRHDDAQPSAGRASTVFYGRGPAGC